MRAAMCSTICVLAWSAAGLPINVSAQALPQWLRSIPGIQGIQAGALCSKMKDWVAAVPAAAGSRRIEDLMPLLEDARFEPVFGRRYEQLTMADFKEIQAGQQQCMRSGTFTPGEAQTIQYLLNPSTHTTLSRQLATARAQRAQHSALLAELDQLQPREADVARLNAIQAQLNTLLQSASADERRIATARVDETRHRIVGPLAAQRIEKALNEAQGRDGLVQLANAQDELGRAGVLSPSQVSSLRQRIAARMDELAAPVIAEERANAAAIGSGLPGLEAGVAFLNAFDSRYSRVTSALPELGAIRKNVVDRRESMLPGLQDALLAEVRKATNEAQVGQILNRYLTPSERQGSQRALVAAAQERRASLQRTAENDRIFGVKPEADDARAQSARKSAQAGKPGRPVLSDPAEMRKYNEPRLVKAIYEGDLGGIPKDSVFVRNYLVTQARSFQEVCKWFTLAEIREFETAGLREQTPMRVLGDALTLLREMQTDSRRGADIAAAHQKRDDAPDLADADLVVLVEHYGKCESAILRQYARNLGSYLKNAGRPK
jgi:uncharacterized protein YdbL (DUF1318 family)